MKDSLMLVLVLNKTELLDDLLVAFREVNLPSATVLRSMGMMQSLSGMEEQRIISTLAPLIMTSHSDNKTIFMIVDTEKAEIARQVVRDVLGDMSHPDTGIMFGLPILFTEGIQQDDFTDT